MPRSTSDGVHGSEPGGRAASVRDTARSLRPVPESFASPIHDPRVVARVGVWLGIAVLLAFLTGVFSHLAQDPVPWLPLGEGPFSPHLAWVYRVTQGVHVAAGLVCLPLLLGKLYAAYPALFARPAVRGPAHALERASVALLVASASFQVVTGVLNTFQVYPWEFSFRRVHFAVAWVLVGSMLVHVAVKLPTILRVVRAGLDDDAPRSGDTAGPRTASPAVAEPSVPADGAAERAGAARRGFLAAIGAGVLGLSALTLGQTVRPLAPLAVLAPRDPRIGPQGLPVNKTARGAGIGPEAVGPGWRLELVGPDRVLRLDRDALLAMPRHEAVLPIACVEGWSATAAWSGVRLRDLVALVGAPEDAAVLVESLQESGLYRASELAPEYVWHPDTLLALRIDGEDLHLDHGFPARLIAPNRPGVRQTKWVARIEVLGSGGDA
ncbi:molybdopterin-dependent oxidoreductase [Beutenbergia cavernae]|nr:molybdopterin-dependent oxidoreductase [Beutenbergia cavernae]